MARSVVSDETWDAIRADYASGMTYPECSKKYGVSLSAITKQASRGKWGANLRKQERNRIVKLASEKMISMSAEKISKMNEDILNAGLTLFGIAKAKMNVFVQKVNSQEPEKIDSNEYKKIVDAYHVLIIDLRLQTGQSTENVATQVLDEMVRIDLTKEEEKRLSAELDAIFKKK